MRVWGGFSFEVFVGDDRRSFAMRAAAEATSSAAGSDRERTGASAGAGASAVAGAASEACMSRLPHETAAQRGAGIIIQVCTLQYSTVLVLYSTVVLKSYFT